MDKKFIVTLTDGEVLTISADTVLYDGGEYAEFNKDAKDNSDEELLVAAIKQNLVKHIFVERKEEQ